MMQVAASADPETTALLPRTKPPKDRFHVAYFIYFTLGAGYLLPWNAFITPVDYFEYLYPDASVDRSFSVAYLVMNLTSLLTVVWFAHKWDSTARINLGYAMYLLAIVAVPSMDYWWIKDRVGVYGEFYATVGLVGLCGLGDGLVCGVVGKAGELPERYMQAVFAGMSASGLLVTMLRVFTKSVYPQNAQGLRQSAHLYFIVTIIVMFLNILFYNLLAHKLPIIKYYDEMKTEAIKEEKEQKGELTAKQWRSTLLEIMGSVKWYGAGITVIYIVTLSIFPGSITEDFRSDALKDWYPIILIVVSCVFDLTGRWLTSIYLMENKKAAVVASFGRILLLPLYYGCLLHGPGFLRTEIPVMVLTGILFLTNGYFSSVLMILGPKAVSLQHAETAGIVLVLYTAVGMVSGSVVSWFWVL